MRKLDLSGIFEALKNALLIYGESYLLEKVDCIEDKYDDDVFDYDGVRRACRVAVMIALKHLVLDMEDAILSGKDLTALRLGKQIRSLTPFL